MGPVMKKSVFLAVPEWTSHEKEDQMQGRVSCEGLSVSKWLT